MSLFIEVDSIEKGCPVIINLDHVIEIAPMKDGSTEVKMSDDGVSRSVMRVKNHYSEFRQFVMQTVSSEDIAKRIESINKAAGIQTTEQPKKQKSIKIPKFDGSIPTEE